MINNLPHQLPTADDQYKEASVRPVAASVAETGNYVNKRAAFQSNLHAINVEM